MIASDKEWMIKVAANGSKNLVLPDITYIYKQHSESLTLSRKNVIRIRIEHLWIAQEWLKKKNITRLQRSLFNEFYHHNLALLFLLSLVKPRENKR